MESNESKEYGTRETSEFETIYNATKTHTGNSIKTLM